MDRASCRCEFYNENGEATSCIILTRQHQLTLVAGSVSALRGFFCGDDGEKIVFEYCPWFCVCCERKREVGVLDGVATVQLIEKIRGEARKRMNMER